MLVPYSRQYKELIFTNHALDRCRQRKIDQGEAWATWRRADKRYYATTKQAWVFQRNYRHRQIEVVAKQNEQKQWVVISVWSNYVTYRKPKSLLSRFFRYIRRRIKKRVAALIRQAKQA